MFIQIPDRKTALNIANLLFETGAVRISAEQPFKWASGWNSPIYCDNRVTLAFPVHRKTIKMALTQLAKSHFPNAGIIAGVATAGIPQAALLADSLSLPLCYVRPKPKEHGMQNLIEGKLDKGAKVIVVEDLVSTGGSSLKAVESLREAGAEVLGMLAVFTYGFHQAEEAFAQAKVPLFCLSDYSHLLQEGLSLGVFRSDQLAMLENWRTDPGNWGKKSGNGD